MHHPTYRIAHTTAFVALVVEHWLEREIAQWGQDIWLQNCTNILIIRSFYLVLTCFNDLVSVFAKQLNVRLYDWKVSDTTLIIRSFYLVLTCFNDLVSVFAEQLNVRLYDWKVSDTTFTMDVAIGKWIKSLIGYQFINCL